MSAKPAVTKTDSTVSGGVEEGVASFTKSGQRQVTPSPGAGDRVFYESLFNQKPSSEMALIYCVEHGVLTQDALDSGVFARYLKVKKLKGAAVSSAVPSGAAPSPAPKKPTPARKRKANEDDSEADV